MLTAFPRLRGAALVLCLSAGAAQAGAADYRFELVTANHRAGSDAMLDLRLTDLRTGAPVEGAVIYATRLDMAPDGMATMTAPVTPMPGAAQGLYRFSTSLTMAGAWRFSVAAKIQGELETVTAELELRAEP